VPTMLPSTCSNRGVRQTEDVVYFLEDLQSSATCPLGQRGYIPRKGPGFNENESLRSDAVSELLCRLLRESATPKLKSQVGL
jgi:hypothetical protein